jgi:ferredoxin
MRAANTMMHALQERPLADWSGPPMVLIRPPVGHRHMFSFPHVSEMIEAGYLAAGSVLDSLGDALLSLSGVFPRQMVSVFVDRAKCIGCGMCVALAPRMMAQDSNGKAYVTCSPVEWSPADGDFVQHCPTEAISVLPLDGHGRRTTRPTHEPTLEAADD